MKKIILASVVLLSLITSCKKKTVEPVVPPPVVVNVPERLELTPTSSNAIVTGTVQFTAKFFNTLGVEAPLPATAVWSSMNTAIATVSATGLATGVANGNTTIKITYNAIVASSPITIIANPNQLASVTITQGAAQDLLLGQTALLTATGANAAGGAISGLAFSWMSSSTSFASVSAAGMVTAAGYGSANISASAMGVQSSPTVVSVIRQGNFSLMGATGTAKLRLENGILKLTTSSNFSVAGAPDLRIYLNNNASNITGSVQVASLSTTGQTTGARSWNVPMPTTITQYRYAVVWCAQFGGVYGVVDFGP